MALAKTTRPDPSNAVPRPRLLRRLDRTRDRPVTWVWGPPGSGKTSLVASYLKVRKLRVIWYQIDESDADVATFFYYLGKAAPRRRRPLALLTAEYQQQLRAFSRSYFRELYDRLTPPFVLVFDNYQDVPADSVLHEVTREAVAELPSKARAIFVSRVEPPPAFARLRTQQALDLIDGTNLRFTRPEAHALVQRLAPGRWSRKTIDALHASVDGWCAGLVLRLEQLRNDGRPAQAPGERSSELLFDYFAGEIFKKTDPETQETLLQTAFLPRITAALAESLTGRANAGRVFATLHKQGYFTTKLNDDGKATYEYHPLFREFLLAQAGRAYAPDRLVEIRRRSAELLDGAGAMESAATLLRDAEDWDALSLLVFRHAQTLLAQGRASTVEEWVRSVPEPRLAKMPWLLFWRGMCSMGWRHAECQRDLTRAFTDFRRQGDAVGMFTAWSAMIFSLVGEGQLTALDGWITLLDELTANEGYPSKGVETRAAAAMLVAIAMRRPAHPRGDHWAERALTLARHHPDPTLWTMTASNWLLYKLQRGTLSATAGVVDELRTLMRARDVPAVVVVGASMAISWYEALSALPSYRRTVDQTFELSRTTGMFYTARHVVLTGGIMGALCDGDLDTAVSWLGELGHDVHTLGPGFRSWYYWLVVWEALLRGDSVRAASYEPEMLRSADLGGRPLDQAVAHLMSAEVRHAHHDDGAARAHLASALEIGAAMRSPYTEFMARMTEAHLCLDAGSDAEGRRALVRAMELGRAGGFLGSQVWLPPVVARLAARALEEGIEVDYVRGLVERRRLMPSSPPFEVEAWPWPIRIFTLGRFEVSKNGAPVQFSRKVQRKPLALLKTLIAVGGRSVREELVMDALWPDAEGDAARAALASAVHRLRTLLGQSDAVLRQEGLLSLDMRSCWVDVWAVERLLERAEAAEGAGAAQSADHGVADADGAAWREAVAATRKATDLYRGGFLAGEETDFPQATVLAGRLRRRLLRQLVRLAWHCESDRPLDAVEWYEAALGVDACAEDVSRGLMRIYHRLGRTADALDTYRRAADAVQRSTGSGPSAETEALLASLRRG